MSIRREYKETAPPVVTQDATSEVAEQTASDAVEQEPIEVRLTAGRYLVDYQEKAVKR